MEGRNRDATRGSRSLCLRARGTTHAFANVGDSTAIMLTVNAPAGHERGFQGANELMSDGAPAEAIQQHFANHDFVFHESTPA